MLSDSLKDFYLTVTNSIESCILKVYENNQLFADLTQKSTCSLAKMFLVNDKLYIVLQLENQLIIYSPSEQNITLQIDQKTNGFVLLHKKLYYIKKDSVYEYCLKKKSEKLIFKAKGELTKIQSNGSDRLAVSNTKIYLIEISGTLISTFSGHSSEVLDLTFASKYLYSCASQDRFITCWSSKGQHSVFVVDSPPVRIDATKKHLMAFLENGVVALWDAKNPSSVGLVELNAEDKEDAVFLDAYLDGLFLVVSYGNQFNPTLERINPFNEDGSIKSHLVLTRFLKEAVKSSKKAKMVETSKSHVLGPTNYGEKEPEPLERRNDITLEEQVKALPSESVHEEKKTTQVTLQQILTQGITSGDVELLERAFKVTDKKVINATVQRMNPTLMTDLLDSLVVRLQKTPNRAPLLIEWIRAALLHHSGYLLSVPELTLRLSALYKSLNARQETMGKLLKLSGRLDMVTSQMETFVNEEEEDVYVFDAEADENDQETNSEMDEFDEFDDQMDDEDPEMSDLE